MSYRFEIEAGKSKRFPVGGKYCEEDIIVTALGGSDAPDAPVTPEYTEGLAYTYDEYGKCYEVGRGDWEGAEELRIPSTYDDGVNGELPVKGLEYGAFQNMTMIKRVYADSLTYSRGSSFEGCSIDYLSIKGYKMTASFEFSSSGVKEVIFGDITYIDWGTFGGCSPTCRFDFSECTQIPSLDTDALGELTEGAQIVVPAHLKEEWKQATNWTLYADYIVAKGQENAQEKTIDITENGSYEVIPDEGKLLSKVGVNVNVGGGGGDDVARSIVDKTITAYSDNEITTVGAYAFNGCNKMTSVNLQNATSVGDYAFSGCSALTDVNVLEATTVNQGAFQNCTSLTRLDLPKLKVLNGYFASGCSSLVELNVPKATSGKGFVIAGSKVEHLNLPEFTDPGSSVFRGATSLRTVYMPKLSKLEQFLFMGDTALESVTFPKVAYVASQAMESCSALTYVDLPICKRIDAKGFNKCSSLETLILRKSDAICTLANVSAFTGTPIASGTGFIYVPKALVDSYKSATNWSTYAAQFRAIEDYPDICGG